MKVFLQFLQGVLLVAQEILESAEINNVVRGQFVGQIDKPCIPLGRGLGNVDRRIRVIKARRAVDRQIRLERVVAMR